MLDYRGVRLERFHCSIINNSVHVPAEWKHKMRCSAWQMLYKVTLNQLMAIILEFLDQVHCWRNKNAFSYFGPE